jgi:hypothetical protein
MKRTLLLLFAMLLYGNQLLQAQLIGSTGRPEVMPASPTAAEFLKYGEIPVGKYTGVPNISVPIYTIEARGLNLPISLTYHSSGIKVAEQAGWTGLGWTLSTGGNIVQVVNGYDDFGYFQNRTFPDIDEIADVVSNGTAPSGILNTCTGTIIGINDNLFSLPGNTTPCVVTNPNGRSTAIPPSLIGGYSVTPKDYEPDVFKFNALGYSGTFIFNWDTEQFYCLTDSKIRVRMIQNDHEKIEIVLPEGHRLEFSVKEETTIIEDPGEIIEINEATSRVYKLDHIYTNFNDHIGFEYQITNPERNYGYRGGRKTYYETTSGNAFPSSLNNYGGGSSLNTEQPLSYLTKITFDQGVVLFDSSSRVDVLNAKKLDRITIKPSETSSAIIKKFDFSYDYFIGHTNSTTYYTSGDPRTIQERTYRLRLNSVLEEGKKPYEFEYNTTQLPEKLAYAQDYWGYYNGVHTNSDLFPNIYRFNYQSLLTVPLLQNNNNRSSRLEYAKAAILEKIIYPTGGYTTFDYQLNTFNNFTVPKFDDPVGKIYPANYGSNGAGLRVSLIQSFNHDNTRISHKQFYYRGGKLMTPLRFFNKSYIQNYFHTIYNPLNPGCPVSQVSTGFRWTVSASSFIPPSVNASGNYVGYDEVEETFFSNDNTFQSNGRLIEFYENHIDEGIVNIGNGAGMITNNHWQSNGNFAELNLPTREADLPRNGSVKEIHIKDKDSNFKQKTINEYNYNIRSFCTNGYKVGPMIKKSLCSSAGCNAQVQNDYTLGVYPIRGLDSYIKSSEKTEYFPSGNIVTKEEYFYNSMNQVTEQRSTTSDDIITHQYMEYPIDVSNYSMMSNNFWSYILKKRVVRNSETLEDLDYTYNSINIPNSNHNTYALLEQKDNITNISTTLTYDNLGNLEGVSQKDNPTKAYYIWGYNGKYPIAKIEGKAHNSSNLNPPASLISAAVSASNGTDHNLLLEKLRDIRNYYTGGVHVTTYTYENLVGVKSITNPEGYTTYYYYDSNNRLDLVKDAEGNVLSRTQYNYKN